MGDADIDLTPHEIYAFRACDSLSKLVARVFREKTEMVALHETPHTLEDPVLSAYAATGEKFMLSALLKNGENWACEHITPSHCMVSKNRVHIVIGTGDCGCRCL